MTDKFACTHCGFIFEDPDMEVCPRCGTELGQEWDLAELRSFVITELTEEQAKFVATLKDSTAEEVLASFKSDGCFALENLTPRQVETYAEFLKQEGIPFVAESEEQKALRLQKQLEAKTAQQNAQTAREQAKLAEEKAKAEAAEKSRMELEVKRNEVAAKAQAAAKERAEAEAEKARLVAITAQAEAEAKAKAQLELDKFRMEQEATEKKNQAVIAEKKAQVRRKMIYSWGSVAVVLLIGFFIFSSINTARKQTAAKNSALSDLQVLLRDDPFMTYETYTEKNSEKLTLADFDKVYQTFADDRKKITKQKEDAARLEAERIAKVKEEARTKALADLKILLRNDPFLTYGRYSASNPEKLTLAEFDSVYQTFEETRSKMRIKRKIDAEKIQKQNMLSWTLPNGSKLEMVFCPAGSFMMGSPAGEDGRQNDEEQHQVSLTKPFLIGKYEVTQKQYEALMGTLTKEQEGHVIINPDCPMTFVSYNEALEFCTVLNVQTAQKRPEGYLFTLPTEAQWEYACRAGTTTSLNSGRNMKILGKHNAPALDLVGWYGGNCGRNFQAKLAWDISKYEETQYKDRRGGSHPVGQKMPNAWGIYDMHGNASEWCLDWYNSNYGGDTTDPTGPANGLSRVFRGGGWDEPVHYCRSACRRGYSPGSRDNSLGFRIVLSPVQ